MIVLGNESFHPSHHPACAGDRAAIDVRIQTRRAGQPPHEVRISTRLSGAQLTDDADGIAATLATVIAEAARGGHGNPALRPPAALLEETAPVDGFVPLASVLRRVS